MSKPLNYALSIGWIAFSGWQGHSQNIYTSSVFPLQSKSAGQGRNPACKRDTGTALRLQLHLRTQLQPATAMCRRLIQGRWAHLRSWQGHHSACQLSLELVKHRAAQALGTVAHHARDFSTTRVPALADLIDGCTAQYQATNLTNNAILHGLKASLQPVPSLQPQLRQLLCTASCQLYYHKKPPCNHGYLTGVHALGRLCIWTADSVGLHLLQREVLVVNV